MKRGEMRQFVLILTIVILGMFTFMSLPLKFTSGPTGLSFSGQDIIGGCATVNTSTNLSASISSSGTCITIAGSNLTLDCLGFVISFDSGGSGGDGIFATGVSDITIQNCVLNDVNAGGGGGTGINFTDSVNNVLIQNNTIRTNGTNNNVGIWVWRNSKNYRIINNSIHTVGTSGSNTGIFARHNVSNFTISGNNITTNATFGGSSGIEMLNNVTRFVIVNNTIRTLALGSVNNGVSGSRNVSYNIVSENNITADSPDDCCNEGVHFDRDSNSNNVTLNNISTNGTLQNFGITFITNSENNTIIGNYVVSAGTDGTETDSRGIRVRSGPVFVANNNLLAVGNVFNIGLDLNGVSDSTFENNTIVVNGTVLGGGTSNIGIFLENNVHNSTFSRNTMLTNGDNSNDGFDMTNSHFNNFTLNNMTNLGGTGSYGVDLTRSNGSFFNTTLINDSSAWLFLNSNTFNNFTNTTFNMPNGSINFPGTFEANTGGSSADVLRSRLNITFNNAFLNSSLFSFLNTSAIIELRGLSFSNPGPTVDFNDDGTFEDCPTSICTEISFTNGVFRYNVTQFTSYSSSDGNANVTLTKSDSPDPVDSGSTLSYTIIVNNTGTATANNLTLTDTYPDQVVFVSGEPTPLTGTNNTFIIGNLSLGTSVTVNISVTVSSVEDGTVINNTANVSFTNSTGGVANTSVTESTTVQVTAAASTSSGGGYTTPTSGGVKYPEREYNVTAACFESWACEGWGGCAFGYQERTCVDLSACGTQNLKPITTQDCEMPVIEQPAPVIEKPKPAPAPKVVEEIVVPEENTPILTIIFLVLVGLGVICLVAAVLIMHYKK